MGNRDQVHARRHRHAHHAAGGGGNEAHRRHAAHRGAGAAVAGIGAAVGAAELAKPEPAAEVPTAAPEAPSVEEPNPKKDGWLDGAEGARARTGPLRLPPSRSGMFQGTGTVHLAVKAPFQELFARKAEVRHQEAND